MITRHVVVRGLVQGVFFRDSVKRLAQRHGVTGWIANRPDGAVEAVFEGEADDVNRLVAFSREGPREARVESVEVGDEAPGGFAGFEVR